MRLLAVFLALFLVGCPLLPLQHHGFQNAAAASFASWPRVFHLHEGTSYISSGTNDWMNSSGPANPNWTDYDGDGVEGITLRKAGQPHTWHSWMLYPQAGSNIVLSGDMTANIRVRAIDNTSGIVMIARFFDITDSQFSNPRSGIELGNETLPMAGPDYSVFQLCTFTIAAVSYTIPSGHSLALTLERQDSDNNRLVIYYDKTDYDSYITLVTSTSVNLSTARTEDSSGTPRSIFSDQENVFVTANVTDPFGAYDIAGADVRVLNGSIIVRSLTPMDLSRTDPSLPGYWKSYNLTLSPLPSGSLTVNITARDPQGAPTWITLALTIVTVDHFGVAAPSSIVARTQFSMIVTALDSSNAIVSDWIGTVQLRAYHLDLTTPGSGALTNSSIQFNFTDSGQVTVSDQNYSFGEEVIAIQASSGSHMGWSASISVSSGPVSNVTLNPAGPSNLKAGSTLSFLVIGRDSYGNVNTTWSPNWTASAQIGSVSGSGLAVTFVASNVGSGNVTCKNDLNGAFNLTEITVMPGDLVRLAIFPLGDIEINEGESQVLTAHGYDLLSNEIDITSMSINWDTNTSGSISWSGPSATYRAGVIPETGAVHVRIGGLTGSTNVTVLNGKYGPWFSPIPMQIKNEDSGSWDLSLTGYWHDVNGTGSLFWWVEDVNTSLYFVSHDSSSNAVVKFFTQPDQFGDDEFVLWAVDPDGYRTYQVVSVRIMPVNDAPKFVNSPPDEIYVAFEIPYTFDFTYYVYDVDNPKSELTMSASESQHGVVSFEGLIATFLFHDDSGGRYFDFVTFTVSDIAGAESSKKIVVQVTRDRPPALNGTLPNVTLKEGDENVTVFDLDDYFYDIDSAYLIYTSGFQHIKVDIDPETHVVNMSALEEWSGSTEGSFTAKDDYGAIKIDTVVVTVTPVNDPPQVVSPGTIHVRYNETYYLPLSPYVYDPDNSMDSLTFALDNSNVTHSSTFMGSHRLELLFPPSPTGYVFAGPYLVSVRMVVTDPLGASASCDFTVMVSNNSPPVIIAPNPDEIYYSFAEDTYLNNSMRLYDLFSDPDDSQLIFTITGNQNVHFQIFSNGIVNLTATVNWSGTEILEVMALDSHLGWAKIRVHITVTEVNDAPYIYPIRDIIIKATRWNYHPWIGMNIVDSDDPVTSLIITCTPQDSVAYVGGSLYINMPDGVDVMTVTVQASDGEASSNAVTFRVGIEKPLSERAGWPYSFPLVLLAAAVAGYFLSTRIPRPYALENLFLIHNDGRLVAHVTKEENTTLDKDVVSAMFTAVQEFVKDSFQKGEVGLKKLEIGDKSVVIEKGQFAYLALIYSGWPERETFDVLTMLLRDIEERYKGKLEKWNGTMKTVKGVDKMLQEYMAASYKPGTWHEEEEIEEAKWVDILEKEA